MKRVAALLVALSVLVASVFPVGPTAYAGADNGEQKETVPSGKRNGRGSVPPVTDPNEVSSDRFIVKYKDTAGEGGARLDELLPGKVSKTKKMNSGRGGRYEVVTLKRRVKTKDFAGSLGVGGADSEIEYVQPDYQLSLLSDDPYFESQWGLENTQVETPPHEMMLRDELLFRLPRHLREALDADPDLMELVVSTPPEQLVDMIATGNIPGDIAPETLFELVMDPALRETWDRTPVRPSYACDAGVVGAWAVSLGEGVVVAVIDTGIDVTHEDLVESIWTNPAEIPGNGIDDDGNGYVDDVQRWNSVDDSNLVFDSANPSAEEHGTHVAGVIAAAKDNGIGIVGVAPTAKVMSLKAFGADGTARTSDINGAIGYAESMGARVVNCSWGSTADNPALKEAIEASDMLCRT